jgi:hypothetical protein
MAASVAEASPDLVLDGQELSLAGTHRFRIVNLSNGAKLVVPPYAGDPKTGGRLEIIAHYILIDATSTVNATAAGYRGLLNADGEGEGGGKGAMVSSDATGGGGHGAPGGHGVLSSGCVVIDGATGGQISVAGAKDVTFGGAGSAAGTADGTDGGRGGRGGGAILLRAGRIELDGRVLANGETGGVFHDDSAGGGAGGGVLLQASQWLGFGGVIEANGAPGGVSSKCQGGGGGGGFLRLLVQGIPPGVTLSQLGGSATCAAASGQNATLLSPENPGCLDLDNDGFQSNQCGGTDCDDSDPLVKKGGVEVCNGQDDDCDGQVDEGDLCPGGQCVGGACVWLDGGLDGAADSAVDGGADSAVDGTVDTGTMETGTDALEADGSGKDAGDGPSADGGVSESGTHVALRGGCRANPVGTLACGWWVLGLACVPFVRTLRRR